MVFGILIKYGLPTSFVYCTVYQQSIWDEGSDRLINQQRDVWTRVINYTASKCQQLAPSSIPRITDYTTKFELPDKETVRKSWNCSVKQSFWCMDEFLHNPTEMSAEIIKKVKSFVT